MSNFRPRKSCIPERTIESAPADSARSVAARGRIPSLDGLRGVSILLVLLCHVTATANSPIPEAFRWYAHQAGVGVDVFFVISGFLITTLLLREKDRDGAISLRGFYMRRGVRLLPAFAVFLGVLAVLDSFGWIRVAARDWIAACTYTVNFTPGVSHHLGHIWSLSVEEHFYLLWPPALVLLGALRAGRAAFVLLLAEPVIRWVTYLYARDVVDIDFATFARLDAIAVGCLLAMAARVPGVWRPLRFLDVKPAMWFWLGAGALLLSACVLAQSGKYAIVARPSVNALAIGVIVWTSIRSPGASFGRLLNWRPLVWIGTLSYSVYLWQQIFLDSGSVHWTCRYPQNVFLSVAAGAASYYLIERPCLSLRSRRGKADRVSRGPHECSPAAQPA